MPQLVSNNSGSNSSLPTSFFRLEYELQACVLFLQNRSQVVREGVDPQHFQVCRSSIEKMLLMSFFSKKQTEGIYLLVYHNDAIRDLTPMSQLSAAMMS